VRRWYVWVSVSVVLFGLLMWRTRPWDALSTGADWRLLLAVLGLNLVVIGAWAARSERLMAAVGHRISGLHLVPIVSFANTINSLTPASSGEAVRAMILRRRHGVPYGRSTAVILVERFWAIWIMATSAGAAALGAVLPASPAVIAAGWLLATAAAFAPAVAYRLGLRPVSWLARAVGPRRVPSAAPKSGAPGTAADGGAPDSASRRVRLARLLRDVDASLGEILVSPAVALSFVAWTTVVFATSAAQLWLILGALGAEVSPVGAWAALGVATIAGVLSALPFGLGAADVVLTGLLAALGVGAPVAAAAALLLRATVTLPLGLAGTWSWIALNRGHAAGTAGSPEQ
jgi:uncharacterized membrane protein YbhN (UPF0104 family)